MAVSFDGMKYCNACKCLHRTVVDGKLQFFRQKASKDGLAAICKNAHREKYDKPRPRPEPKPEPVEKFLVGSAPFDEVDFVYRRLGSVRNFLGLACFALGHTSVGVSKKFECGLGKPIDEMIDEKIHAAIREISHAMLFVDWCFRAANPPQKEYFNGEFDEEKEEDGQGDQEDGQEPVSERGLGRAQKVVPLQG